MSKKELSPQEVLKHLFQHVFGTYVSLRLGMAIVAVVMAAVVWLWGWAVYDIPLQPSISAYYWTESNRPTSPDFYLFDQYAPSRVWFVGGLFALAACLFLYKGFSRPENYALNAAALFTLGVALFPMCWRNTCGPVSIHGICAILAFACLFYVMWRHSADTLALLPKEQRQSYKIEYKALGITIFALPLIAYALGQTFGETRFVFFIEWSALVLFAQYWRRKTKELEQSKGLIEELMKEATEPANLENKLAALGLKKAA